MSAMRHRPVTACLLFLFATLVSGTISPAAEPISAAMKPPPAQAAAGVVSRILPERAGEFVFGQIPADHGLDVFEIAAAPGGGIAIRGNNAISMASGFNWYLKHVARCDVSWNGDQLDLPNPLPAPAQTIRRTSPTRHGFYFNYCTFNYTMAWWDWPRWEREIDFMALCGIDMPLAIVGTEAVWLHFLERFGYTKKEAKEFIAGPGYTAWWLMGNLEGRGGPVGDAWIERQAALQKKILARMRELGMRPVLPGFVGLVPTTMAEKCGVKTLPQGGWAGGHTRPAVLHPDDPRFDEIATAWYEELEKLYGKADCFAGDLFHEGGKSHGIDVAKMAAKVQAHMIARAPDAVWTLQAWGSNPRKDLLASLKKENTLVIDLCGEFWRRWEQSEGFHGTPWVFGTIVMYGGNVAFHGRLESIRQNLNAALASPWPPSGLGATWESIEVNPVVMEYLWDMKWRTNCPPPAEWARDYAARRYGCDAPDLKEAWKILVETVYGSWPGLRRPQESLLCAVPSLNVRKASPFAATCKIQYDPRRLRDALALLLSAADPCRDKRPYQFDAVDVARQFLANTGQILYHDMIDAFNRRDKPAFEKSSAAFLALLDDQDRLLATEPMYMLGTWLHDARKVAPDKEQADQNEQNARWLVTTWTPQKSGLNNYAWREWSGLMKNYYKPRWQMFIDDLASRLDGVPPKKLDYYPLEKAWCDKTLESDPYPAAPHGDPVATAREMLAKYGPLYDRQAKSQLPAAKATRAALLGTWEYKAQGITWRRVLRPDGGLDLYRNGKKWPNWKNFTWKYDPATGHASLRRASGREFATMKLIAPGKAEFEKGMRAVKLETGKNTEAEEAAEGK
jgi:alpha-N-acetylglucosaminidase